jgi:hypothetical protein
MCRAALSAACVSVTRCRTAWPSGAVAAFAQRARPAVCPSPTAAAELPVSGARAPGKSEASASALEKLAEAHGLRANDYLEEVAEELSSAS